MNEFTPILYKLGNSYVVPLVYKKDSPLYEGYHDPFWRSVKSMTNDMEIRTRNFNNNK